MAERSTARKKPQSLNDSHYRFLQEMSATRKPSSQEEEEEEEEPFDDDDDSDRTRLNARITGRKLHNKAPSRDERFDDEKDDQNVPSFSLIPDFDTPPEEKKPTKVKIEGRRRLCKLKSVGDEGRDEKTVALEDSASEIHDFKSPIPPSRLVNAAVKDGGANEITDILGELSARLEFLSIEKRKPTKFPVRVEERSPLFKDKNVCEEKKEHPAEYASAGSSFSPNSVASASSSDEAENVKISVSGVGTHEEKEEINLNHNTGTDTYHQNALSDYCLISDDEEETKTMPSDNHKGFETREVSRVDKKSGPSNKSSLSEALERENDDDDEDDCIAVSGNNAVVNDEFTLRGAKYTYRLSGKIAKMLFPHQREGLNWLWSLHCQGKGGILGDDMGLGKTMQICGFLAGLFHSRLIRRAMIVAPKTLLSHWIKELTVVGLSDKIREYYGTCIKARQYELKSVFQDKGILLTTYDIVRANSKALRGDNYYYDDDSEDGMTWDYMILDEGHLIKNPSTQRAKSLLEIPSAHRIIISGTPIQNNLKELWALFNFCCPDLLGDKQGFKIRFENAIIRGNEKNASEREKRFGSEVAKGLRECIRPYFLRRLKNEVFNEEADNGKAKLSKKNEIIVWLRLTSCQRQIYEAYLKSELVLSACDGSPLAALTILKKICDHPLLLTKRAAEDVLEEMDSMLKPEDASVAEKLAAYIADAERENFEEDHVNISCKISFILSLLDDLIPKGHNVLIFSQTRKMLNLIQDSLVSNGYGFSRIDGTTKASDRIKIVDDFQNGVGASIFMLTSQVGGLGLTLTRADRVIVVDPAWNPSTDNQSVDRAYRIGQLKDVIVYRLMTCGTVEEKIYRKQIYKGGLFKTATEHKEQTRYFSQQDLRELFSLPKDGFDVSPTQLQLHQEHDCHHVMDENLKSHIEFLETKGIAGVSHHSLLFSKTEPVQNLEQDDEVKREAMATIMGASSSSSSSERNVDGSQFAFKPKDLSLKKKSSSPDSYGKLTESELRERISSLHKTAGNMALVSRLPDKGAKIVRQIAELNAQLRRIREERENIIDLEGLSGDFNRVLNV